MKTKRRIVLIAVALGVTLAFGLMALAQSQQSEQQTQLIERLSLVRTTLGKFQLREMGARRDELQTRLGQDAQRLEATQKIFPESHNSIEMTSALMRIAAEDSVEISSLDTSGVAREKVADIGLDAMTLTINARGAAEDLMKFIARLNASFAGGVVKSARISIPDGGGSPSADIRLVVYAYPGG